MHKRFVLRAPATQCLEFAGQIAPFMAISASSAALALVPLGTYRVLMPLLSAGQYSRSLPG